jgi:hypothetical protein
MLRNVWTAGYLLHSGLACVTGKTDDRCPVCLYALALRSLFCCVWMHWYIPQLHGLVNVRVAQVSGICAVSVLLDRGVSVYPNPRCVTLAVLLPAQDPLLSARLLSGSGQWREFSTMVCPVFAC